MAGASGSHHSTSLDVEADVWCEPQDIQSAQRMEPVEEEWSCQSEGAWSGRLSKADYPLAGHSLQVPGVSSINAAVPTLPATGELASISHMTQIEGL